MTVGVDIRVLTRGARTGVEEYTINLLSRLFKFGKDIEFKLFYGAFRKENLGFDWARLPNVKLIESRLPSRPFFLSSAYLQYPKIDKILGGADVYFNPHFFNSAVSQNCRKVVTFHDLSFWYYPELFSWRKRFWHKLFVNPKKEARGADKIIAVSESTKQDLTDLYGVASEKIKVIYSGVGEELRPLGRAIAMSEPPGGERRGNPAADSGIALLPSVARNDDVVKRYHLPEKFILYFGTIEPRKNITGLIKAFEILKENKNFEEVRLLIAGAKGWSCKNIFKEAQNCKYGRQIICTGFVAPEDKVYLYNLAELFVYPSFFEGFGFPPLEAMACGAPVITSSNSSLPEVVGDAALMVNPFDVDELAWAMEEVLTDESLRQELVARGLERAKMFSWDKCAGETLKLITYNL